MSETSFDLYIGFSRPRKFKIGAYAISKWMKRPYSHVYVRFVSSIPEMPSSVYHAAHGMVHFRDYSKFLIQNESIKEYRIPISANCRRAAIIRCMQLSGDGYGYRELVKIFTSDIIYHCFQKEIRFQDSPGYICSELVGTILSKVGVQFDLPMFLLKPDHVDDRLLQMGFAVTTENS